MDKYNLEAYESVLMENASVHHRNAIGQLVLTDLNLLHITTKRGVFKTTYATRKYPIKQIKMLNGKAQVFPKGNGEVDIYLMNGRESFEFCNSETFFSNKKAEKEAERWTHAINNLLTGEQVELEISSNSAIPGTEYLAATLRDTIDVFKGAFSIKTQNPSTEVAQKCTSCEAPISGIQGHLTRCKFCGSNQRL